MRFIELMQTPANSPWFADEYRNASELRELLLARGFLSVKAEKTAGPAALFAHETHRGRVGLIAPYAKDFCQTCNRLRVSALGALRLCLFGTGSVSLRPLLQSSIDLSELRETVTKVIGAKPASHDLHHQRFGSVATLSSIGG